MREAKRGVDNAANELKTELDPFQSLVIRSQNVEGSEEHLPDSLLHLFTQACHLRASRCAGVLSHEMVVMHRENEVHLVLCSLLLHAVPLAPRHAMVEVIRAIAESPGVLEVSSRSVLSACIQGGSNEVLQMLLDSNGILRRLKINEPGNVRRFIISPFIFTFYVECGFHFVYHLILLVEKMDFVDYSVCRFESHLFMKQSFWGSGHMLLYLCQQVLIHHLGLQKENILFFTFCVNPRWKNRLEVVQKQLLRF